MRSCLAVQRDPGAPVATSSAMTTATEGRVVAIIRDGLEFDELTGHGEARSC